MSAYIARRILLMIPTLLGILFVSFIVVQFAPGGPVERVIAQLSGADTGASSRISGSSGGDFGARTQVGASADAVSSKYRGAQGLDPDFIKSLEKQFGFDKPAPERFLLMVWNFARFDFGKSYFRDVSVLQLIKEKLPVSMSLGIWMTLLTYLISIPLGIRKAVQDGSKFDTWTSAVIIIGFAIPGFLFAILLIILFAGGSFFNIFPLRGLTSDGWAQFPWYWKILDYFWHIALPLFSMALGAFATMTLLTKNSFLDEIRKQYVMTARAKGCSERQVLYNHIFRNAMLIVIAGFPGAFIHAFFSGSLLIETIFSLDGLGLLGFESVLNRDYPVVFGTLFIFSLVGLVINLVSDLAYMWIDPQNRFRGAGSLMTLIAPQPIETTMQSPLGEVAPMTRHRFSPSPLNRRRWQNFKSNRRGYWSFWIFLILFFISLFAELIANDRPFLIKFDGHLYFPAFVSYSETTFGGDFETAADYRDPYLQKLIADKGGTVVWPLIRYSYHTHNLDLPTPGAFEADLDADRSAVQGGGAEEGPEELPRSRIQLARHRRSGPRRGGAADLRLPHLGAVRAFADHHLLDHRHRRRRGAGLFRRLGRSRLSALHRGLDRDPLALSAVDPVLGAGARLLRAARNPAAVLVGVAGRPGARRIPARPQFRIHHGGAGARRIQCQDHVPAPVAERHGRDHDLPALHRVVVGHDADRARFPRLRTAAGLAVARRNAVAGQGQRAGAVARLHRIFRGRHHAVAADLHRRSRARRVRSAQDVSGKAADGRHQPAPARCSRPVGGVSPAERHHRSRSIAFPSRSSAASAWRWSANPAPANPSARCRS